MKNKEIELKFILNNPTELKEKLDSLTERQINNQYQKDVYYTPTHKNFLDATPITEWLRLRKTNDYSSINYKNWHKKEGAETVVCDEFESRIEDYQQLAIILNNLDFQELVTVEKCRNSWKYKKAEISIDEVTELGSFVEIEAKGEFSSVDEAEQYVYTVAEELEASLGSQEFRGYPYRILELKGYKF